MCIAVGTTKKGVDVVAKLVLTRKLRELERGQEIRLARHASARPFSTKSLGLVCV